MKAIKKICVLALSFTIVSCATIEQTILLEQVDIGIPVSGSMMVINNEKIYQEEDYLSKEMFSFKKTFKVSIHDKEGSISINNELKNEIYQADYDSIVGLKMVIKNIDSSAISSIYSERYYGLLFALNGLAFMHIVNLSSQNSMYLDDYSNDLNKQVKALSAVLIGTGSILFVGSFVHEKKATIKYIVNISGYKVKY